MNRVRSYRLGVNNLAERLPAGSFVEAAFAGLQDSAPRAALLSLHARVQGLRPDDWEHSSLVQTWAPRGAVFIVPNDDLSVFARGIVPRNPAQREPLERAAAEARRFVDDAGSCEPREMANLLGEQGNSVSIRLAAAIAGLPIRWDARTTTVLSSLPANRDDEDARLELARRFLRSLGPADAGGFARWAAVSPEDAEETFGKLDKEGELAPVPEFGQRVVLTSHIDALKEARSVKSVRFLPFGGDPVLQPGDPTIGVVRAVKGQSQLVLGGEAFDLPRWAVGGAVLFNEDVVAAWGRTQGKVQIMPLRRLSDSERDQIDAEAGRLPIPNVDSISIIWRENARPARSG
jgi:hypothetical protein